MDELLAAAVEEIIKVAVQEKAYRGQA